MIKKLSDISRRDIALAGGKGASLGELIRAGFAVPDGFIVSPDSFDEQGVLIDHSAVVKAFANLDTARVAVRSSAVAEDAATASWAGQLETYLNVTQDNLIERIEACWSSVNSRRAEAYAKNQDITNADEMAVVVQAMVDSETSGVLFTVDPTTESQDILLIEACYGLGELLVQGDITPESIAVNKKTGAILHHSKHTQARYLKWEDGKNRLIKLEADKKRKDILSNDQIASLVDLGKKVEQHYGAPQDIEWAIARGKIWLLQARPITAHFAASSSTIQTDAKVIASGVTGSKGFVVGSARIVRNLQEINMVAEGDILVTPSTTPDYVETFTKVAGIVTDIGGVTSHAAIVCRELGISAIVNTGDATKHIKSGDLITLDASNGKVYRGKVDVLSSRATARQGDIPETGNEIDDLVNAMSNVYVDVRELWPYPPINLFPYFDVDQAVETYEKLKQLIEAGVPFAQIAKLFKRAEQIRYFLINTGVVSLKTAHNLKLANVDVQDQIKLVEWCIAILKELTRDDPLCLKGKNLYWNQRQVNSFVDRYNWQDVAGDYHSVVKELSVNLYSMNWAFYWNYYGAAGYDMHGPYTSEQLGGASQLLIKDYFDPAPVELWPLAKEVSFKSALLAQIYDDVDLKISFGNRLLNNEDLAKRNSRFALLIDDQQVTDIKEMKAIAKKVATIARKQTQYVNRLSKMDVARQCARLSFYIHKNFYLHFGSKWYPEEAIEETIKTLGNKFINAEPPETDRTPELKKQMLDPRNYITP